jgi:hypothetical protein
MGIQRADELTLPSTGILFLENRPIVSDNATQAASAVGMIILRMLGAAMLSMKPSWGLPWTRELAKLLGDRICEISGRFMMMGPG